ncbi:potassium channel beta subunit family protein [Acidithiobacillus sulfurivorans]|nr:aldo/keto reductase [Acidithiobacillus sulfurivorans]
MSADSKTNSMIYRHLGRSGLQVSLFSLGSWVTFHNQVDASGVREMMAMAWDAGVNFFDNAEVYANGESELLMGKALKELAWNRLDYVISSKFFWGLKPVGGKQSRINSQNTLNRKYLMQAIDGSLQRLKLDYLDLIFCHRADPHTPVEETVWAMHNIIEQGKALYWGTSEWSADEIRAAWEIAERHHLHKPVMEQPQYHLFHRQRVEKEYARLYNDIGLGLTTWSPLASGLLTGKYVEGIPDGSRGAMQNMAFLQEELLDQQKNHAVAQLQEIAHSLDCSVAQLALAWVAHNPRVSTVILGASRPEQLQENLAALDVLKKLNPETVDKIEGLTAKFAD